MEIGRFYDTIYEEKGSYEGTELLRKRFEKEWRLEVWIYMIN